MFRAVQTVFTNHAEEWEDVPAFASTVMQFATLMAQLEAAAHRQDSLQVGVKAVKDQRRSQAAEKAMVLANALRALSTMTGDAQLAEQLRFKDSALLRQSTNVVLQLFARIREQALTHLTELADFGITEDQVDAFTVVCDDLPGILGSTRSAIVDRSQQTHALGQLTTAIGHLLADNLDKQVKMLRPAHPELFQLYTAARTVVDYKGKSQKPKVPGEGIDGIPADGD